MHQHRNQHHINVNGSASMNKRLASSATTCNNKCHSKFKMQRKKSQNTTETVLLTLRCPHHSIPCVIHDSILLYLIYFLVFSGIMFDTLADILTILSRIFWIYHYRLWSGIFQYISGMAFSKLKLYMRVPLTVAWGASGPARTSEWRRLPLPAAGRSWNLSRKTPGLRS